MSQDMQRLLNPLHECQKWLAWFVAGAAQTHTGLDLHEHLQHDGSERQHLLSHSHAEMLQASCFKVLVGKQTLQRRQWNYKLAECLD